jgi:CRISPR/Cas system CSM-associated protein Csm3 (group 7 of RAMP superfamily)
MLKKLINNAQIEFDIIPLDPLLIKSGQATVGGVDMSFVRTFHAGESEEEPFIPGSSIKGMIRAYAEKICRSLKDKPVPVCLPYVKPGKELNGEHGQASCGLRFDDYKKKHSVVPSTDIYKHSCPICRFRIACLYWQAGNV